MRLNQGVGHVDINHLCTTLYLKSEEDEILSIFDNQ